MNVDSLSNEQILFLAKLTASTAFKKAVDAANDAVAVGHHSVAPFSVEVGGSFDKGEDQEAAGTVRGLTGPVLGLTLHYAGVTAEAAEAAYTKAVNELGGMTAAQQKRVVAHMAEERGEAVAAKIEASIDATMAGLRQTMPTIVKKGTVRARGFVRPVSDEPAPVLTEKGKVEVTDELSEAVIIINS